VLIGLDRLGHLGRLVRPTGAGEPQPHRAGGATSEPDAADVPGSQGGPSAPTSHPGRSWRDGGQPIRDVASARPPMPTDDGRGRTVPAEARAGDEPFAGVLDDPALRHAAEGTAPCPGEPTWRACQRTRPNGPPTRRVEAAPWRTTSQGPTRSA
jgi:hypothetical protein